jgi:ribonuclease M5
MRKKKHRIREIIVVEGRYDKNTVSQVVDTLIVETSGYQIFNNREAMNLLRRLAKVRGIIILTDSDSAGFMIRNYIKGSVPANLIKHAYIPDVYGKERRKSSPSKEGKLGVEGMSPEIILDSLRRAGSSKKATHVGIYIGNNSFIHAVNSGKPVTITSLSQNYYKKYYVGAGRVFQ